MGHYPYLFCGRLYSCPVNDSFLPAFPKARCIYFTRNDQNSPDRALTLPSDPCPSTFLVSPSPPACLSNERLVINYTTARYNIDLSFSFLSERFKVKRQVYVLSTPSFTKTNKICFRHCTLKHTVEFSSL